MSDPQNIPNQKTSDSDVKWIVEIYPFDTDLPSDEQGGGEVASPSAIIGSASLGGIGATITSAIEDIGLSLTNGVLEDSVKTNVKDLLSSGLTNISISRSKASPAATASFSVAGSLPSGVFAGSWVIISTASAGNKPNQPKLLTRFIGQISKVQSQYVEQQDGLLTSRHTVMLREWSFALTSPIEFHRYSVIRETVAKNGGLGAVTVAGAINAAAGAGSDIGLLKKLQEVIAKSFDPLELAQAILMFIGSIEEADYLETTNELKGEGFTGIPTFATTMPSVPTGVLQRLGLDVSASQSPFTSGFVRVVTGSIPPGGINNSGDWGGMFEAEETTVPTAADFATPFPAPSETTGLSVFQFAETVKNHYLTSVKPNRPKIQGVAALCELSYSAWDMLNKYADSSFNEFYTDMWYEKDINGQVIGKPVMVCRDKPFMLAQFTNPQNDEFKNTLSDSIRVPKLADTWTKFDDLPRVRIPSSFIKSIGFNNSADASPNYLQISINPTLFVKGLQIDGAGVAGIVRKGAEINRFGGNSVRIPSAFMATNEGSVIFNFKDWFTTLSDVFGTWYSYGYRSAQGALSLKDNNIPISVGFNMQLTAGIHELVAHVDGYSMVFQVGQDGLETTNINVQFSRLTKVGKSGMLEFLEPNEFGNLFQDEKKAFKPGSTITDSIPSIPGLV